MRSFALLAMLALSGCLPETGGRGTPAPTLQERAECSAAGGDVVAGGLEPWICEVPLPDGGQSCTRGSDCAGFCLAETRTCAPVRPYLGCTDVLWDDGEAVTICVD
ncbi:hypothetical protein [Roseisalinus antarcticus]|uniref:Uncharacterized protein n=1 Tax=Roseisalinus antarcticus TaxID=254357 RepID=A0A1Y5RZU8_9RHOB|nr:hypothetical protein [Roseisalinus antarcticus]SLN28322.1 hypothetical protein ROA7023_00953 [Roseisalinus antarcticus]